MRKFIHFSMLLVLLALGSAQGALQIRNLRVEPEFLCPGQEVTVYFESVHDYNAYPSFGGVFSVNNTTWDTNDHLFLYNGAGTTPMTPPISPTVYAAQLPGGGPEFVGWYPFSWKTTVPASFAPGQFASIIIRGSQQLYPYAATMPADDEESIRVEVSCFKGAVYNRARLGEREAVGKLILVAGPPAATLTATPGDTTYTTATLAVRLATNAGNVIYWTTDPSLDPAVDTLNPAVHKITGSSGTVTISGSVTLKAWASGPDYLPTAGQWRYIQQLPAATLSAIPGDTSFRTATLNVRLTTDLGTVIYWTTDPSLDPAVDTLNPAVHRISGASGTVTISGTVTLKAWTSGPGCLPASGQWHYTRLIPKPVRLELNPDSATISAGDSVPLTARIVDDTGGVRTELAAAITWTLTPGATRSTLRTTSGAHNTMYGIDAYQTCVIIASFTDTSGGTHRILSDTARITVNPGAPWRMVIEADTVVDRNRAHPVDEVIIGPTVMQDTVYGVIRDRFDNFCRFATNGEWSSRNPAIASVSPLSGRRQTGVIRREGSGTTFVIATESALPTLIPDTVRVIVAAGELTGLRLVNSANGTVITSITMKTGQSIGLTLQGTYSYAPGVWVGVRGAWNLTPATLTLTTPLPADSATSWTLSPLEAGRTELVVTAPGRTVRVPVTVKPVIIIGDVAVCENPFTPGVSQIPVAQRQGSDPATGSRIEVRFSAPVADNTGAAFMTGRVAIFDAVGNQVTDRLEMRPDGPRLYVIWEGKNRSGAVVSKGSYLAKIEINDLIDNVTHRKKALIGVK